MKQAILIRYITQELSLVLLITGSRKRQGCRCSVAFDFLLQAGDTARKSPTFSPDHGRGKALHPGLGSQAHSSGRLPSFHEDRLSLTQPQLASLALKSGL